MTDITIPPEALEAAAIELYRSATHSPQGFSWATVHPRVRERWRKNARAACLAMLREWPGQKWHYDYRGNILDIILPLPKEPSND
jgi:hypothetical protein